MTSLLQKIMNLIINQILLQFFINRIFAFFNSNTIIFDNSSVYNSLSF